MANSTLGKKHRKVLALFNAGGTNKNRLTLGVTLNDVFNNHVELDLFVFIDQVRLVGANHWLIGRNWNNAEFVGGHEFGCLSLSGTGHTGKL